ncbi:hypothetical protein CP969_17790 [Streptomyces viridosporus T7A]|uniref:Uncharacterized protein n=1 Tax=Streptomyces viridosporus T7A TaxID=665577 RepID=A0ABX6AFQ1_STRVD|nr:hypothetical protein CP969_17790 [Streptomyces viridosporus T7A]
MYRGAPRPAASRPAPPLPAPPRPFPPRRFPPHPFPPRPVPPSTGLGGGKIHASMLACFVTGCHAPRDRAAHRRPPRGAPRVRSDARDRRSA